MCTKWSENVKGCVTRFLLPDFTLHETLLATQICEKKNCRIINLFHSKLHNKTIR